jgi:putative heme-binding domain-containing protein
MLNAALIFGFLLLAPLGRLDADEPLTGEALFNQSCASCHGPEGAGGRGPSLRRQLRNGNLTSDIKKVILNGLPGTGMPKFHFGESELLILVPYVQSLSRISASPHPAGDKAGGERIYKAQGCPSCHKIGSVGTAFGPNLTRVGAARSYEYLKASLLNPSSDIPDSYAGVTIVDHDGKRYRGVRVNEDSFTIQLRLPNQKFLSFDKQAIEQEVIEKESLMPPYQFDNRDLTNLLAYLSELVGPSPTAAGTREELGAR